MTQRNAVDPATGNYRVNANGHPVLVPTPTLGVVLGTERQTATLLATFGAVGLSLKQVGQMVLNLPQQLVHVGESLTGQVTRDPNGPVSLVGVGAIAGQVAADTAVTWQDKLASGLLMLASLNFALFVFNLIPLLPLDGGHVAGGIYEAIKRALFRVLKRKDPGPADTARLMPLTYLVWFALMASSLLLVIADIVNPIKFF
jgi:membrane-associated protease RseP (regulator of RpoE activity)